MKSSGKITIKDVAKQAGVSVATVSYVINERTDMRISEETRKKVLQVINLLGYSPNQSAKALASSKHNIIALSIMPDISILNNSEQLHFFDFFSDYLHDNGYDLVIYSANNKEKYVHADAIVCYNTSSERFRQIADNNFIPLIAYDCMVNDPLFYQINTDFDKLLTRADYFFQGKPSQLVLLNTPNEELKACIAGTGADVTYIKDLNDICAFKGKNLIVVDKTLSDLLSADNKVYYSPSVSSRKIEILMECLREVLHRTPIDRHNLFV
jgi:transcriptional regulator with XRE-family HTH domain